MLAFLPKKLQCQGRIKPEQVWDYVDKLELSTSKQVVITLFEFANEDAEVDFISLFTYFNSRQRCGVLGGGGDHGMKDMYLVPIAAEAELPKSLGPGTYLKGAGLPTTRETDIIMGVFVANATNKKRAPSKRKRDSRSSHSAPVLSKQAPDYLAAYGKSSSSKSSKSKKRSSSSSSSSGSGGGGKGRGSSSSSKTPDADLDRPYSPSQDDDLLDQPYSPSQDDILDDDGDKPYSPSDDFAEKTPAAAAVGGGGGGAVGNSQFAGSASLPPTLPPAPVQSYSAPAHANYNNQGGYGSGGGANFYQQQQQQQQQHQQHQHHQQQQQQQQQQHYPPARGNTSYGQQQPRDPYAYNNPRQQQQQHQQYANSYRGSNQQQYRK